MKAWIIFFYLNRIFSQTVGILGRTSLTIFGRHFSSFIVYVFYNWILTCYVIKPSWSKIKIQLLVGKISSPPKFFISKIFHRKFYRSPDSKHYLNLTRLRLLATGVRSFFIRNFWNFAEISKFWTWNPSLISCKSFRMHIFGRQWFLFCQLHNFRGFSLVWIGAPSNSWIFAARN